MWNRIVGRDDLIAGFRRVWSQGRLGQAYLFCGPSGVGKCLFAMELAKALLCEKTPTGELDACGACLSCRFVDAGTHADLHLVSRPTDKLELPIDTIRELGAAFSLKPSRGKSKIAILDRADEMNDAAANAFLKTLEEPPPSSHFILLGTSPDQFLPTIVSRCQVIPFSPLPDHLVPRIVQSLGVSDQDLIAKVVARAGGSPGRAMELADPTLWGLRAQLIASLVQKPVRAFHVAKTWMQDIEASGKDPAAHRGRASLSLSLVIDFLHDALVQKAAGSNGESDRAVEPQVREFAEAVDEDRLFRLLERALDADRQIARRMQLVLVIEAFCDAWASELSA